MSNENNQKGSWLAIAIMFMLFFMIAFVTNCAGSMGIPLEQQFGESASQYGSSANFFAYLFMGIPGGLILKRKGYKFTALLAVAIGVLGLMVQIAACYLPAGMGVLVTYISGAFIAGFSMCLLNLVVNPLLNTLGGGGNKGNQLVQFGCSLNSIGATLAPIILGNLIASGNAKAQFVDAVPALGVAIGIFVVAFIVLALSKIPEPHLETAEEKANRTSVVADILSTLKFRHFTLGAIAIFCYITIESGIPNFMNLYMSKAGSEGYVGTAIAGSVVGAYWFCMMIGRLCGGAIGGKVSSRTQITVCSILGIAFMLATMFIPVKMFSVSIACGDWSWSLKFPLAMVFGVLCGLCTSVMWGGIFNMAAEGLGKYVPVGAGIFMSMVFGGMLLNGQAWLAKITGYLNSYWMTIGLFAYVLFYALIGSRVSKRADA